MPEKIEKEAKFYIRELKKVEADLIALGARCIQPRTLEVNLRFDTPDHTLSSTFQVLRLRQDTHARLTYKGPANPNSTVSSRPEYEVEISDLETGQHILESLGYEVVTIYEKYRAAYLIDEVEISLDEMPFGDFIEIEGPSEKAIQLIANKLSMIWENRSLLSYMRIFKVLKENLGLSIRDLTFKNFSSIKVTSDILELLYSDH